MSPPIFHIEFKSSKKIHLLRFNKKCILVSKYEKKKINNKSTHDIIKQYINAIQFYI